MNWDVIGSLAEILGALGVVASLVYFGMQVHQNTRTMHDARSEHRRTHYKLEFCEAVDCRQYGSGGYLC